MAALSGRPIDNEAESAGSHSYSNSLLRLPCSGLNFALCVITLLASQVITNKFRSGEQDKANKHNARSLSVRTDGAEDGAHS